MDQITVENYRCFYHKQDAHLAPLTLLVGENSTGKTSFMAMIQLLRDHASWFGIPDFKKDPYDLGSFDEIAHHRGAGGGKADTFKLGFSAINSSSSSSPTESLSYRFEATFGKRGTAPALVQIYQKLGDSWVDAKLDEEISIKTGTTRGNWKIPTKYSNDYDLDENFPMTFLSMLLMTLLQQATETKDPIFVPLKGSPKFSKKDTNDLRELIQSSQEARSTFANAPVRSKPRRTYEPTRSVKDPEGDYIPMHLANAYFQQEETWKKLKEGLEEFGRASGLFDEISIKMLGKKDSEPFQLEIRKFGTRLKGPPHNLIDVGYGISQVLPVITELFNADTPQLFLLQQPEVHLHPSAQAALGSLFCQAAKPDRQLIVETHSDYLLDRIRIDIRDQKTHLTPNDVSILFFERNDIDVTIHSLRIDEDGNVKETPPGYRKFFMRETANLLGL